MRTIGIALIMASLALGTGGVSIRPASASEGSTTVAEYAGETVGNGVADKLQPSNACKVPEPARPVAIRIPLGRFKNQNYVHLNTRGYNYPSPDDPPERSVPSIPSAKQSKP